MGDISNRELEGLRNSVQELSALNEIAAAINLSMSVNKITQTILACCLKKIMAEEGALFLLEEDIAETDKFRTFIRKWSASDRKTPFHLHESLVGWMIKHKSIFVMNDPDKEKRFSGFDFGKLGLNSLLAAPLISRHKLIGVLVMFNKRDPGGFSESDKRFLGIVGTQTATVIANARLFEKEQKLLVIEEEMRLAKSIQENYLPRQNLETAEYEILGFSSPAKEVGGDYWDMIRLDEDRVFVSVGDVSGKGIPAALLAAQSLAILRSQLRADPNIEIGELTNHLNRLFFESSMPGQFMTSFLATYDAVERRLCYVNAGHMPPFVLSAKGRIQILKTSNLIIGVLPNSNYTSGEVVLNPGDTLFMWTDGVTENFGPNDEEYGEDRLKAFLSSRQGSHLSLIRDDLMKDLEQFRQGSPQSDDITFMMIKAK